MESDQCSVWIWVFSLLDLKKDGLAFLSLVIKVKCVFTTLSVSGNAISELLFWIL